MIFITLVAAAVAAAIDVRERRIPNALSFGLLLIANVWRGCAGGFAAPLIGAIACGVMPLWLYVRRRLGAGDVKLLVAIGAALLARNGLCVEAIAFLLSLLQPPAIERPAAPLIACAVGLVTLSEIAFP